jgi:WD40 repeat protein
MKPLELKRIFTLLVAVLLVSAAAASAQDLPARSFQRFGTTKLRHGSRILCLAYANDGQILAAGGGNDPVRLWNPKTGEMVRELNEPWVHAMSFSPSGETLLFGGYQRVIKLWNFRLNKETGRLDGHKATVKAIVVSPDASTIISGSQDGAIYLWDMNNKRKVAELPGHIDEVNALAYYADKENNGFLASAGSDRVIIVWNMETNTAKLKFDAGCGVYALAVSADGKTLYSAGDDYLIRRWDVASGKQTGTFKGHDGIIVSLILQGDTIVSGALDKTIRFWNAKTTEQLHSLPRRQGDCDALAMTKNGAFLATAGLNNTIRIFETANLKEVIPAPGIQSGLAGLVLSPDNTRLASVSAEGRIYVWDPQNGKLLRQWDAKQSGDIVLAYAPGSRTLATAFTTVRLWNAETGAEIGQLPINPLDPVETLAFSSEGKTLALGLHSGQIDLWDVKEKKTVGSFKYVGSLHALAWSPDGKKLAAAGGAKILVWDPQANALVKSFDVKEGPPPIVPTVRALAFGPDSKTLAAAGFDAVIRIYNLNAKNPTSVKEQRVCEGHLSSVYALAFSPDGRSLVSGSFDKTVRLWEAFSGKQIALFKGHIGEVTGVGFVNDGRSVFSAGADSVAYHWDVPGLANNGKLPALTLPPQELEDAWTTLLSEETARGHETMWKCIASAKQAIPHLTKVKKLYLLDPERVKKLFRDLDSGHYPTRTAAMTELSGYGRWMEGRYEAAMANAPSLEYKRRVEMLKEKLNATNSPSLAQERLRVRRIMLMCEQAGGPDAVAALRQLAERGPEEEIRDEAQASLGRLSTR